MLIPLIKFYFTHIGPNLAANIPPVTGDHLEYLHNVISNSIFVKPTDVIEIKNIVRELHPNKSPGYDGFSAKVIKGIIIYVNHCVIFVMFH